MSDQDPVAWLRAQVEARHELALLATANRDPRGSGKRLGGGWETGCTCKEECQGYPACEEVTGDGIHDAREDEDQCLSVAYPCRTVRLLASGYRHKSGYEEAWKA